MGINLSTMNDKIFYDSYDGKNSYVYVLRGDGIQVGITDFGAAIQYILIETPSGVKDITLGYRTISDRINSNTYCGATVGRVANRTENASFIFNNKKYNLTVNDGKNHLHGGTCGFDKRFFNAEKHGNALELTLDSPDGDQGYEGNMRFTVTYILRGKSLFVNYSAVSDKATPFAPTCHVYFNLNGEESGDCYDNLLRIYADEITQTDENLIVHGEKLAVKGTVYDYTRMKFVAPDIDVNYILKSGHAAHAESVKSGICVDVFTDMPGLQFYSGGMVKGRGKTHEYGAGDGFCLEPQFFPNSLNIPWFNSPMINANSLVSHFINYDFSVKF